MTTSALTILFLTMFFIMLGFGIIIPHLAYYADELGASPLQIGGLLAIYSAMQLVFAPMWGRLSDRKGRKPFILIGLIGNAAALILFGFSNSLVWAFTARALSGAWSAAVLPTVMAYVADVTTEEDRGKGMASMGVAMGLGFILGPAIGAIMHQHHTPFFLAGILSVATFVFALILLPESLKAADRADGGESWVSPWEIISPRTFSNPLMPLYLVAFCSTFVFSGLEATFPLFIADRWEYGAREMGQMFVIMGSIVALMQGSVLGRLINKCGEFRLIVAGLLDQCRRDGAAAVVGGVCDRNYLSHNHRHRKPDYPSDNLVVDLEGDNHWSRHGYRDDGCLSKPWPRFRSPIRREVIHNRNLPGALLDFGGDFGIGVGVLVFPFETDWTVEEAVVSGQ